MLKNANFVKKLLWNIECHPFGSKNYAGSVLEWLTTAYTITSRVERL